MTQRTTLTDVFGTPCMEGEALMAAIMYRPYDTGYESSYVTLRTPFFKVTTDHYGNITFKGTKAQGDGILRGFLLDVSEPVTFEGLVGRKGEVRMISPEYDTRLYYKAFMAGQEGKALELPPLYPGDRVKDEGNPLRDELERIKTSPVGGTVRQINPFVYHVSRFELDPIQAVEMMRLHLGIDFEVTSVCGGMNDDVALVIVAKTGERDKPHVSRKGDVGSGYTYMSHGRFDLQRAEVNARMDARDRKGHKAQMVVVRETTYRDILATVSEDRFLQQWWDTPNLTWGVMEKHLQAFFKELQKRATKADLTPDDLRDLGNWCYDYHKREVPEFPYGEGLLSMMEKEYTQGRLHLVASPLHAGCAMLGAGVPIKQVVKAFLDGLRFMYAMNDNGIAIQAARHCVGTGGLGETMAGVITQNAQRASRYGKKPWETRDE